MYKWLKRAWYRTWALLYCSKSAAGCKHTNYPVKGFSRVAKCG